MIDDGLAVRIEQEHLPYPVSVIGGEIVGAGDVSYFALSDRIGQTLKQRV